MSKLKKIREELNLTQDELSEKSSISIRTIQRIEAGTEPKGKTLKILSRSLGLNEKDLCEKPELQNEFNLSLGLDRKEYIEKPEPQNAINLSLIKGINISSLLFAVTPPLNVVIPLLIMFIKKQYNPITKQIVSIQILWLIIAMIIFMLTSFIKNWFSLGSKFSLLIIILLVLTNVFIIIRNTAEIDKKGKLFFYLNFSII